MTSAKTTSTGILLAFILSASFVAARCHIREKGSPMDGPITDPSRKNDLPKTITDKGFAVLELFTSEGCSSCPAADKLLAQVQEESGNKSVYALAYHVDYWDRLGWKDKFSSPAFSKRQYQYHDWFTSQVYTPQLVINGHSEFVGSDASAIRPALKRSLEEGAVTTLELEGQLQSGKIKLDYQTEGDLAGSHLLIAVVQKHSVSKIERGENAGLTLSHAQIVRNLYEFRLTDNKGSVTIDLPEGFNTPDWELIGILQNPKSGVIKAAARLSLNTTAFHSAA